jgi:hypothetical protein
LSSNFLRSKKYASGNFGGGQGEKDGGANTRNNETDAENKREADPGTQDQYASQRN